MIRLVVISDSPPTTTRYFDQPTVTIGSATSPAADLSLSEKSLYDSHIQIIQEQKNFYLINVANDPFATLNGKPFGKKKLNPNDIIQIGNALIRFESENKSLNPHILPALSSGESAQNEEAKTEEIRNEKLKVEETTLEETNVKETKPEEAEISNLVDTTELLPIILEKKLSEYAETLQTPPFSFDLTPEEEELLIALQSKDIFYQDYFELENEIDFEPIEYSQQMTSEAEKPNINKQMPHPLAESLATAIIIPSNESLAFTSPNLPPAPAISTPSTTPKLSLKDYYLSEYDDVGDTNSSTPNDTDNLSTIPKILLSFQNWIIYLKVGGIFVVIGIIALSLAYLWMTNQSDKEEITASKAVADVAMALTYAQIKNIHPQNQNWSDPEFIKNHLTAVLPSKYSSYADFDTHGQFINCPYFLRIYTSGDLSQFLVIAQPAPSVLQWLIPKATIIIDSNAMQMRKTHDLKSLNRLLVNANTLDGTSAVEVSHLVQQGKLISLDSLVNTTEQVGFLPPKALALMRPGAENLVYNAPRYFPLSEELMKKSMDLIERHAVSPEVVRLQHELGMLKKLPDVVFYISGGIQSAILAHKALTTLSPKEKFLIAYLQINNKGQVFNSHIFIDDSIQEVAINENNHVNKAGYDLSEFQTSLQNESQQHTANSSNGDEEEENPLLLQFSALNACRQQALRPVSEELISKINQETNSFQENFESKINELLAKYIEIENEQQFKILQKLESIYHEYRNVSAAQFFHLAKIAGVKQSLTDFLAHLKQMQQSPEFTKEQLDEKLQRIEKTSNWQDFEQEVVDLIILNFENIPDEERIIAFQNATRSKIIQKLNQFILSPEHPQILQSFGVENRYILINILKKSWITDSDSYEFYLNEFDLRMLPRDSMQSNDGEEEEEE
ncbi:MAG: FHA domain-containing protein [Parachlamydiaceae bacterium]|nr:FHA domain-containing protein [Parachlamydiaceae bacterium]